MRQDEGPDSRGQRELRRLPCGRVRRFVGPVALLFGEGRVVDEDVRPLRSPEDGLGGARVAGQDELPPWTRLAQHLLGPDGRAVLGGDRLAALQGAEERPRPDAEPHGRLDVEATGAMRLDERIAVRRDAMTGAHDLDAVVAAVEDVARPDFHELVRVRELPEDPPKRLEEVCEARWAVDPERKLAPAEREGLHHPGKPQVVVRVVVRQEDLGQLHEPDAGAQELAPSPLAAVDENPLPPAPKEERRGRTSSRGDGAGCPQEDEVEVHGASVGRPCARAGYRGRTRTVPGVSPEVARPLRFLIFQMASRGSPA